MAPRISPTLLINEVVAARRAAGQRVLHLGFGEAGLPVPDDIRRALLEGADANAYGPVAGAEPARAAAADWFTRRDVPTGAGQIILAPGSKALLFTLIDLLDGPLYLPIPSWVSYAAQAEMVGREVVGVAIGDRGGAPDPGALRSILQARAEPGGTLLLTIPDNPTGTIPAAETVAELCVLAKEFDLAIISDEIYAEIVHPVADENIPRPPSPVTWLPERTVITSGLSKSVALGGYRIGFARTPEGDWGERLQRLVQGAASEIWSSLAGPMQGVAEYVLGEPEPVRARIAAARRLHGHIARTVADVFVEAGALVRPPTAAFYLYPDFEPMRKRVEARGVRTGEELTGYLLDRHGVGYLPGAAFGDDPRALRGRVATSLLYGSDPREREIALGAADPVSLPWIAGSLEHLRAALAELLR